MTNNFQFNVEAAWESLKHLSVSRVVNYLTYVFDGHDDEIKMEEEVTTPYQVAVNCNPSINARRVPIQFWGGPPDEAEWYDGNLLTLLIDRLFYNIAIGNYDAVRRFQGSFRTNA